MQYIDDVVELSEDHLPPFDGDLEEF